MSINNLDIQENMREHVKINENGVKVITVGGKTSVPQLLERQYRMIKELEERIIRIERAYDALGRRLEGSERHVEDEGWFD